MKKVELLVIRAYEVDGVVRPRYTVTAVTEIENDAEPLSALSELSKMMPSGPSVTMEMDEIPNWKSLEKDEYLNQLVQNGWKHLTGPIQSTYPNEDIKTEMTIYRYKYIR